MTGASWAAPTRYQSRQTAVTRNSTVGMAAVPLLYAPSASPTQPTMPARVTGSYPTRRSTPKSSAPASPMIAVTRIMAAAGPMLKSTSASARNPTPTMIAVPMSRSPPLGGRTVRCGR